MGQYEKAEPLLVRAMDIRKQVLGEDHADYANSLNSLAVFYQVTGQYEKAEPLLVKALSIRKNELGENHPEYATSLNNLAILYQDLHEYAQSRTTVSTGTEYQQEKFW